MTGAVPVAHMVADLDEIDANDAMAATFQPVAGGGADSRCSAGYNYGSAHETLSIFCFVAL